MRVAIIDKVDLPLSMPTLELLLAQDRRFHLVEQLLVDEAMDVIPAGVTGQGVVAVLPKASDQVGRDPDVERTVELARKDIDAGETIIGHGSELAARWTLKQVQGDEE